MCDMGTLSGTRFFLYDYYLPFVQVRGYCVVCLFECLASCLPRVTGWVCISKVSSFRGRLPFFGLMNSRVSNADFSVTVSVSVSS